LHHCAPSLSVPGFGVLPLEHEGVDHEADDCLANDIPGKQRSLSRASYC
jgi:hypothetical protein